MLATQFLNVVLEENDTAIPEHEQENEQDEEESNNNTIYDIISQLDIKSQLAKILLAECIIEPSAIAQKREKPVLSFEANVTPIYNVPPKKPKTNDELSLLTAVEAVYSDGEENDYSEDSSPMVPCPICNRSFSRNCSLALHMKSHEPLTATLRRYQRQFTGESYYSEMQQQERGYSPPTDHMDSIVQPTRRYECQYCHRSYTQKSVLKKHLVVHTGERERCNICGAGFSQRSSLVRHAKRIHGGLVNHAVTGAVMNSGLPGNGVTPTVSQITTVGNMHNTPILTTALSNVTHPTLGTPLIVGIPLNQLAAGKFAGTQFAATAGNLFRGGIPGIIPSSMAGMSSGKPTTKAVPAAIPITAINSNLARFGKSITLTSNPNFKPTTSEANLSGNLKFNNSASSGENSTQNSTPPESMEKPKTPEIVEKPKSEIAENATEENTKEISVNE